MKRGKKFIVIAVIVVIVLGGTIGGVALAQADDEDTNPHQTVMARVAEILGIDQQELENAFNQARSEIIGEGRESFRHMCLDNTEISDELRQEIEEWLESRPDFPTEEFKAWMESRPNFPTEEFKEWMELKPDIPFGTGLHGEREGRGFHRFGRGFLESGAFFFHKDN